MMLRDFVLALALAAGGACVVARAQADENASMAATRGAASTLDSAASAGDSAVSTLDSAASAGDSAAGVTPSTAIPFKEQGTPSSELTRVLAALGVCAFAGLAGVAWLRRRGMHGLVPGGRRRLQVIEVHRLGVKGALVLLRWDDEEVLVLQGEGQAQLLGRKPAAVAVAAETGRVPS